MKSKGFNLSSINYFELFVLNRGRHENAGHKTKSGGEGVIKTKDFGTEYDIEKLSSSIFHFLDIVVLAAYIETNALQVLS